MLKITALLAAFHLLVACAPSDPGADTTDTRQVVAALTDEDRADLAALDNAYAQGWMLDDPAEQKAAVLALFAPDAVGIQDADRILEGRDALAGFWFPEGYPPTEVSRFERTIHSIDGTRDLAIITGKSELDFTYDGRDVSQGGNYLIHAARGAEGDWKITRFMWAARVRD